MEVSEIHPPAPGGFLTKVSLADRTGLLVLLLRGVDMVPSEVLMVVGTQEAPLAAEGSEGLTEEASGEIVEDVSGEVAEEETGEVGE